MLFLPDINIRKMLGNEKMLLNLPDFALRKIYNSIFTPAPFS